MTAPTEHHVVGVGLCSCGSTYSLRWMDYDEWMADHPHVTSPARCDNYGPPYTCLDAGTTTPCDYCRARVNPPGADQ